MKAQGWRDEVNQRRQCLQRHAGKISIAWQVAPLQVIPHVPPVTGGLQSQADMLGGFQFENGEPAAARDAEQIEDAVLAAGIGEDLRVDETRVQLRVNPRDIP